MQVIHLTKRLGNKGDVTDICTDNFYTRHFLSNTVRVMTQAKARITETVLTNASGKTNKINVTKAKMEMKEVEHRSWKLVTALTEDTDLQHHKCK